MARLSGHSLILKRTLNFFVFYCVRFIYRTVQMIWWKINGTEQKMKDAKLHENYNRCVQILRIIWRNKFDMVQTSSLSEYICVHERFESPKYIFDNDHVSLFMINKTHVVFSEAREKGMHLWRMKYGSFLREAHVVYTSKLLVVPIEQFHRMAEELGDPKGKLIFLFNTARCGSTLLAQMFEETGKLITISESNATSELATLFKQEGDSKEIRQLARDVISWTCRPYHNLPQPIDGYVIKLISPAISSIYLFKDVFPNSYLLFMYRDVLKVSQSLFRCSQEYPTMRLSFALGKLSSAATAYFMSAMGCYGPDYKVRLFDDLTCGVYNYLMAVSYYKELRSRGFEIAAIRYEDLMTDPMYASKQILKFCGIPESLAELCVNGMKTDSQENSVLSRKNIGKHKNPELTPESRIFHNKLLKKNGLPLIGEDNFLEGTITLKRP